MRAFFLLVLALNLVVFAAAKGAFGRLPYIDDGREPERLQDQYNSQSIHLLAAEPAARAVAAAKLPLCVEFGGFAGDDLQRIQSLFESQGLASKMIARHRDEQAGFIVYLPPYKTRADADKAGTELKHLGVNDFFIVQDS